MEGQQKTIEYIKTIDELSVEEKDTLVKEIEDGGDIGIVLDKAADKVQGKLDVILEGVELDENDELEVKQAQEEMNTEMQAAEDELKSTLGEIAIETDEIIAQADADLVDAQKEEIEKRLQSL